MITYWYAQEVIGPWIFGPIDFLKIAKAENTFPLQFLMTVELGNRRTTSFNESEAALLLFAKFGSAEEALL